MEVRAEAILVAEPSESRGLISPVEAPAFPELYRQYFPFVWRSAFALGTPRSAMDDVVQEAFVVAYRRLPAFEGRSSVRTWLSGIVLNVVRHHRRAARRKAAHEAPEDDVEQMDVPSSESDPHAEAIVHERTRLLC